MSENGKPATRGRGGLSLVLLGGGEQEQDTAPARGAQLPHVLRARPFFLAAERCEAVAEREQEARRSLLAAAAKYRQRGLEIAGGLA